MGYQLQINKDPTNEQVNLNDKLSSTPPPPPAPGILHCYCYAATTTIITTTTTTTFPTTRGHEQIYAKMQVANTCH